MVNNEYQKSLPNCESYYTELWKIGSHHFSSIIAYCFILICYYS
jgi:hypothetical protein